MIDLTKKDELFFHWLERSENDRGLYFDKGQFRIDWYKVFSKADSRLKIDENIKFKLFDWVTRNTKENFFEDYFHERLTRSNFSIDLNLSTEIREKYKSQIKTFVQTFRAEIENSGLKNVSQEKAKSILKQIDGLEKVDFLDISPLASWLRLDIEIQRIFKETVISPSGNIFTGAPQYFNGLSPRFYQSRSSWQQRKAYSGSVVELMTGLKDFYKSSSWQSSPQQSQEQLLKLAYGIVSKLTRDKRTHQNPLYWISISTDPSEQTYFSQHNKIVFQSRGDFKESGVIVAKKVRSRLNGALNLWQHHWNVYSNGKTISEPLKKAYVDLEKCFQTQLDQDMEEASGGYFDQFLAPLDRLLDYLIRTYLPLSLYLSGVISPFEEPEGEHFLGFSHSAILHHLAPKAFHRLPGQFPLSNNGLNPLWINTESDVTSHMNSYEYDDEDFEIDLDDDLDSEIDFDELMLGKFFRDNYVTRN